jgi:hypothetical protein
MSHLTEGNTSAFNFPYEWLNRSVKKESRGKAKREQEYLKVEGNWLWPRLWTPIPWFHFMGILAFSFFCGTVAWTQGLYLEPFDQSFFDGFLEIGSRELFASAGFKLRSAWDTVALLYFRFELDLVRQVVIHFNSYFIMDLCVRYNKIYRDKTTN